jgi:ribonuclease VapC
MFREVLSLDSSAVIAVISQEQNHEHLIEALEGAGQIGIGAPTLTESSIVLVRRYGPAGRSILSRFLEENRIVTIPFGDRHWAVAAEAFIRFGKGRHPAALNYGDCMTYATARLSDAPLLFVGEDFAKTDLTAALS